MMIAGSTAFVTGVATAAVGLLASPALATSTLTYSCDVTLPDGTSLNSVPEAVTITGTPSAQEVTVGDSVTLAGVSVLLAAPAQFLQATAATSISGSIDGLSINAVSQNNPNNPVSVPSLAIPATTVTAGADTSLTSGSTDLTGIMASEEGTLALQGEGFTANLNLLDDAGASVGTVVAVCSAPTGDDIADVTVKPKPADNGGGDNGGGTSNQGGDNGDKNPPPGQNKPPAGTNSPPPSHTNTNTNTNTNTGTQNNTHARGTLASTGVPYTIPMTATGAALLLAGAVMLVVGRRRRELVVDGAPSED